MRNETVQGGAGSPSLRVSQRPPDSRAAAPSKRRRRARPEPPANAGTTADGALTDRSERANERMQASGGSTARSDLIDSIRLNYRAAKAAERARIVIDQQLLSFCRVYLTAWTPKGEEADRKKASAQAMRVIETVRDGDAPSDDDKALCEVVEVMVKATTPARVQFEATRKAHRRAVERAVETLDGWKRIEHVRGFSSWGLGALIGEAGDLDAYTGCRKVYKRLGLAPDECYPRGEKNTGRMIPRMARGRIMGIIADALLRAQWRGETDETPAHAIGPFGIVYGETKARRLQEGKTKGHADKLARRAMTKALIHDAWRAWHGLPLDYAKQCEG